MKRFMPSSIVLCGILLTLQPSLVYGQLPAASMFHDPLVTHNVFGSNSPHYRLDESLCNIYISPFYECMPACTGGRNKKGQKVPGGDIYGHMNMLGIFFGIDASPKDKAFDPDISSEEALEDSINRLLPQYEKMLNAFLRLQQEGTLGTPALGIGQTSKNFTDESLFTGNNDQTGHYSIKIDHEKIGVRPGIQFTSQSGFGFALKTGFQCYKQTPCYTDLTCDFEDPCGCEVLDTTSTDTLNDVCVIRKSLTNPACRKQISQELCFKNNLERVSMTAMEDTHIQVHWTHPIRLNDRHDVHVANVIPYLAVGAWLPTGKRKNQDILWSLPTGNDGHTGVSIEGALNFNFLELGRKNRPTFQFGLGGSATFFDRRDIKGFRVASSCFQRVLYPWKVDVRRRLGTSWNLYCTTKAELFVEGLTFYGDYVFSKHERDSIHICDSPERAEAFVPEVNEAFSFWEHQGFHIGFNYEITTNLAFGAGLQGEITGKQIYRVTTLLTQVTFSF